MMYLALKYALFAAIATGANIGTQDICLRLYRGPLSPVVPGLFDLLLQKLRALRLSGNIGPDDVAIIGAMAAGTLVGLAIKYVLDKRYIFYHKTEGKRDDLFKFFIYSLMGVVTTVIFWVSELLFNYLFAFEQAKYIGAAVGLTIGYLIKYNLDKRFVFRDRTGA